MKRPNKGSCWRTRSKRNTDVCPSPAGDNKWDCSDTLKGSDMLEVTIANAKMNHLPDCKTALLNSKLGKVYFASDEKAHITLREGIKRGEIFIALDAEEACLGFIWFILKGMFHNFPYIHLIAVQEEFRGHGIGEKLIAFFEDTVFPAYAKAFLLVADFNPEAERLYERLGYKQVGTIPGLYKDGVTEYLMMKKRAA